MTGAERDRTFTKRDADAAPGFFAAEAWGLRWLAATQTVPVPDVISVDEHHISVTCVGGGQPTAEGAERLGRALAELHAVDAPSFGAPHPGFIGPLPLDNTECDAWPAFYAEQRVRPYLELAARHRALTADGTRTVARAVHHIAELRAPFATEPPRHVHGDLWSGNVLWDPEGVGWVIDPAAHGGHRETDLAMLHLFGLPYLDHLVAAYDAARPLAQGWRDRIGLHQLHPLLVHAALFGPSYGDRAVAVAADVLRTL